MHRQKAAVSHCGIWTILSQWAAEFCKLAGGIWQNLPRKTVDPTYDCLPNMTMHWSAQRFDYVQDQHAFLHRGIISNIEIVINVINCKTVGPSNATCFWIANAVFYPNNRVTAGNITLHNVYCWNWYFIYWDIAVPRKTGIPKLLSYNSRTIPRLQFFKELLHAWKCHPKY